MYIRRTRFDDLDDWVDSVNWQKVRSDISDPIVNLIRFYIKTVDGVSEFAGRISMYLLLVMMGILIYSIVTNALHHPVIWVMEMAQFTMAAYYILGGGSSLKHGIHVRMDFLYERWTPKTKAIMDVCTAFFMLFYLSPAACSFKRAMRSAVGGWVLNKLTKVSREFCSGLIINI